MPFVDMATDRPTPQPGDGSSPSGVPETVDALLAHAGWVRALALELAGDPHAADDAVQETWLAALRRPPRADGPLRPWLKAVLVNTLRKRGRGEGRRAERERRSEIGPGPETPDELAERVELSARLTEDVLQLPEAYRDVILRRYWRGLSAAEIARRCELPAATVRSRLARGLALLRERVGKRFGSEEESRSALLGLAGVPASVAVVPTGSALFGALEGLWIVNQSTKLAWGVGIALALVLGGAAVWNLAGPKEAGTEARAVVASGPAEPAPEAVVDPREAEVESGGERQALAAAPAVLGASEVDAPEPNTETGWRMRVVDDARLPLQNASVRYLGRSDLPVQLSGFDGAVEAQLTPDLWHAGTLVVEHPGRAARFLYTTLEEAAWTELGEVVLEPGGEVAGRVVSAGGLPLAGVRVRATGVAFEVGRGMGTRSAEEARRVGPFVGGGVPETITGASGEFRLGGLTLGPARVWASLEGYLHTYSEPLDVVARAPVEDVVLALEALAPEDTIEGVVLDPSGAPAPGAWLRMSFPSSTSSVRTAPVDAEGRFRLVLEQREPHDLVAVDESGRWGWPMARGVEPGARGVELRFEEPRWVEVLTRAGDGEPVPANFVVSSADGLATRFEAPDPDGAPGRHRLRLPTTPFQLEVRGEGCAPRSEGPFDPDALVGPLEFLLERAPGLRGRVTHGGQPVAGARVEARRSFYDEAREVVRFGFLLRSDPHPVASTVTDEDGRYEIAPPTLTDTSEFVLLAEADGFAPAVLGPRHFGAAVGRDDLDLELQRGGVVEGRVLLPPGEELAGQLVAASRGDGAVRVQRTDARGAFRFEALTPGGWQVRRRALEAPESTRYGSSRPDPIEWDCQVYDGEVTHHDLDHRSEALAKLLGRVVLDGEPAEGWTVAIEDRFAFNVVEPIRPATTGEGGGFELSAPAGAYRITCTPPDGMGVELSAGGDVVLEGGEPTEWELAWRWAFLVPGPEPLVPAVSPRLMIRWHGSEGRWMRLDLLRDASGGFERTPIPSGRLTVHELRDVTHTSPNGAEESYRAWSTLGEIDARAGEVTPCTPRPD